MKAKTLTDYAKAIELKEDFVQNSKYLDGKVLQIKRDGFALAITFKDRTERTVDLFPSNMGMNTVLDNLSLEQKQYIHSAVITAIGEAVIILHDNAKEAHFRELIDDNSNSR